MTFNLGVKLTLDKAGYAAGAAEANAATKGIGEAAKSAAGDLDRAARALEMVRAAHDPVTAAAVRYRSELTALRKAHQLGAVDGELLVRREAELKAAYDRTTASIAARSAIAKSIVERSVARQTIVPDRGADIAAYGAELDAIQARWDPLFAATRRYEIVLAEVGRAHAVGAIDAQTLIARQLELKAAYERTTSSMADQARSAKMMVERSVARQTIVPDRGADIAAYGAELDRLREKYNPVYAAGQAYRRTVGEIAEAERVGAISAKEAAAARATAKSVTAAHVSALRSATEGETAHAGSMKLSAFQAQNLSYQLNDVVVSLASGMNPLTVFLQQGSQITPIFGGVGGTLRAVSAWANPATAGIAALGIGLIGTAAATYRYTSAMRDANTAAAGLGRNAGTSAGEIDQIARSSAGAGAVSIASARSMAVEWTRTGKIGADLFGNLISLSKDFGATVGQDTETAAKTLGDLVADPARGAEVLSRNYGLLDSATERLVKRQVDQGRTTQAQATLLGALNGRLVESGKTVAWYAEVWDKLARSASNAYDAIGRATSGSRTPEDKLASLEAQVRSLEAQSMAVGTGEAREFFSGAARQRAAKVAELRKQIEEEKALREQQRKDALADQAGRLGVDISIGSGASSIRESVRRQQLLDEQKKLRDAAGAGNLTAQEEARIATALEAKTRALTTWISEAQRATEIDRIDLALQQARDPVTRALLEAERARIQARGQEMTETEAAAAAERAYARAIGETVAQTRGSIADITADAAARTRVNALVAAGALSSADAAREIQIEAQTRQLAAAALKAEGGERERLLGLIAAIRAAITAQTEAERKAQALQDIRSGDDRLQTLRTQISLVGQSEAQQARMLALLEAEQKIRNQGYGGAEAARIRAQAVETADLNSALERQRAAWDEVKSTGGEAIDTLIEGMRTGQDVGKQLADSLSKEFLKLAIANPLKNMVFGQNLPTLSDAGGLFGGLFGGGDKKGLGAALPSAVGTATITAGTVVVNGGLGLSGATGGLLGGVGGRSAFDAELADPAVRNKLFAMTEAEVGGQGGLAQQAFMESTMNRASARGMSLDQVLSDRAYFPRSTFDAAGRWMGGGLDDKYGGMLGQVRGGSNISGWATGNASGGVGFAGGPQTAMFGGEKFGIEAADMGWAKRLQSEASTTSQAIGGLGSSSSTAVDALGRFGSGAGQATTALTSSSGSIAQASTSMGSTLTTTAASTQSAFGQLTSGLSSAFSSLFSGIGNVLGGIGGGIGKLFGFADGGYTGSVGRTSIAGVVHGGEYVINSWSTARHRPLLEAINDNRLPGYASGGYVGTMPMMGAAPATTRASGPGTPVIQQTIVNNTPAQVSTREESDGKGGRRQVVVIDEMVGQAVGRARGKTQRAIQSTFGLRQEVTRR